MLAGLDIQQRSLLEEEKTKIRFKRGEYIYKEGFYPSGLFCLKKGKVMITKSDNIGNVIVINLHKEVTFLGTAEFIARQAYQTDCLAIDDVEVCLIKKERIEAFMSRQKLFSTRLLTEIANQYFQANQRMLNATKKHMTARLADALLELYRVFGVDSRGYLDVYLKRAELAIMSNMSVANAIRHLSGFQKEKLITIHKKMVRIDDIDGLKLESQIH